MPAKKTTFNYPFRQQSWPEGRAKVRAGFLSRIWRRAVKTRPKYAFALILTFSFVSMAFMMYSLASFRDDSLAAERGIALDHGIFFDDIMINVQKARTMKPEEPITNKEKEKSAFLGKLITKLKEPV